ncbi:14423_t:CDS:1, partial [Dentiscutata erythropus]
TAGGGFELLVYQEFYLPKSFVITLDDFLNAQYQGYGCVVCF